MLILVRNPVPKLRSCFKKARLLSAGARLCARFGFEEIALSLVERALGEEPHRVELHLQAGELSFKLGRMDRAVEHVRHLWPGSRAERGVFDFEAGPLRGAAPAFFKERAWILAAIGSHLLGAHEPGRALSYINRAIAAGLTHSSVLNLKGLCLLRLGQTEEALKAFQDARAAGGRSAGLLVNMGIALNRLGRYAEALRCYEEAQRLGAGGVELFNNKGFSLFFLRRYDEATACFELAQAMEPQDTVRANLALCYFKTGRVGRAIQLLKELVEKNPEDPVLLNNLALCLEAAEKHHEALALYKKAAAIGGPERNTFLVNQAACLAGMGRFEEAQKIIERLEEVAPQDERVWSLKASIMAELGREGEAVDCYRRALGLTG
ncbi:tetratricopeptide repeat protein [Thermodesulfitimonas autotrophica]|uniref:Tetratricopeptide repeat protein n=1 Tax=Thermodesulfitimonas autotrophica TaxID=1894989 RepID=A0A3N5AP34_9THEO|nr:tetratricopeptide repeat protein [Thermodesulfitimonas autotrophica]RPF46976.1 tetratricopeptide repeat protein [Thermodesulfitimonas autotrophica]